MPQLLATSLFKMEKLRQCEALLLGGRGRGPRHSRSRNRGRDTKCGYEPLLNSDDDNASSDDVRNAGMFQNIPRHSNSLQRAHSIQTRESHASVLSDSEQVVNKEIYSILLKCLTGLIIVGLLSSL